MDRKHWTDFFQGQVPVELSEYIGCDVCSEAYFIESHATLLWGHDDIAENLAILSYTFDLWCACDVGFWCERNTQYSISFDVDNYDISLFETVLGPREDRRRRVCHIKDEEIEIDWKKLQQQLGDFLMLPATMEDIMYLPWPFSPVSAPDPKHL